MANYRRVARRAARKHGLDPRIFERQIQQESGFNPSARSPAGASGIAQIMPGTAKGWGVDPMNPRAALNAAARNMASYVRKYGSYENALRAYNAGPGNIQRSKGFGETNAYVRTILGGHDPRKLGQPQNDGRGGTTGSTTTTTTTTPGVDNRVARAQLISSFLSDKGADPLEFAVQARALRDVAPTSKTSTKRTGARSGDSGDSGGVGGVKRPQIMELFWNGPGARNWDEGAFRPAGYVKGHTDHVHVSAGPKSVVALGRKAQQMGLHVGENPAIQLADAVFPLPNHELDRRLYELGVGRALVPR